MSLQRHQKETAKIAKRKRKERHAVNQAKRRDTHNPSPLYNSILGGFTSPLTVTLKKLSSAVPSRRDSFAAASVSDKVLTHHAVSCFSSLQQQQQQQKQQDQVKRRTRVHQQQQHKQQHKQQQQQQEQQQQ
ncbi:hypothetical protein Emag_006572 [Eimeria magna]